MKISKGNWLKRFFKSNLCQCWACKNIRAVGGYQPCHNHCGNGEPKSPPRKP